MAAIAIIISGCLWFVAAQDRNYESFRANLTCYMRIIEDGLRKMNEEYNRMVDEKREAALKANPVIPYCGDAGADGASAIRSNRSRTNLAGMTIVCPSSNQ